MALKVYSEEWVAAFEEALKESEAYKKAGKGWQGDVALHILSEPTLGLDKDIYILLDLHDGECRSIKVVAPERGEEAAYIITGIYENWKQVIYGKLSPVKGMMTGKLKLRKGSMSYITRYIKATQCIVDAVVTVETVFHDK